MEIEARLADVPWRDSRHHIDPHHLSAARIEVERTGVVTETTASSRGGRDVTILQPAGGRRATAIDKASARKRLLLTRYLGWSQGSPSRRGLIGPAGERTLHASLLDSGTFQLANRQGGQTHRFLNHDLDGPLDHAAFYTPLVNGLPQQPVAIAIEVKNMRNWVYPISEELYQVLDKAAQLQRAQPTAAILPVLVCRRAHITTFRMAKELGFFIVPTRRQYIGEVAEDALNEVRAELGFLDLTIQTGPDPSLTNRFSRTVTSQAALSAVKWRRTASDERLGAMYATMRHTSEVRRRQRTLTKLRTYIQERDLYKVGGW